MLSDRKKQMNREGLGARLKEERTKSGFTQKALADALGLEYYVMISQMENGYMSIPPALWTPIADKLGSTVLSGYYNAYLKFNPKSTTRSSERSPEMKSKKCSPISTK